MGAEKWVEDDVGVRCATRPGVRDLVAHRGKVKDAKSRK